MKKFFLKGYFPLHKLINFLKYFKRLYIKILVLHNKYELGRETEPYFF